MTQMILPLISFASSGLVSLRRRASVPAIHTIVSSPLAACPDSPFFLCIHLRLCAYLPAPAQGSANSVSECFYVGGRFAISAAKKQKQQSQRICGICKKYF